MVTNNLGKVTHLRYDALGTTLSDFAVPATGGYDGIGSRLAMTVSIPAAPSYSGTTAYAYDYGQSANPQLNRSQLTGETTTRSGGFTHTYAYDGGTSGGPGNPTSYQGNSNTFNTDNQNLSHSFAYDGNGNQGYLASQNITQTYDPENRLTSYYGGTGTFAYDRNGQQAWKQNAGGQRTYFIYDGDKAVLVLYTDTNNHTGSVISTATFGANGLLSTHTTYGSSAFYTFDPGGAALASR